MTADEAHRLYEQGVAVGQKKGRFDRTNEILTIIENRIAKTPTGQRGPLEFLRMDISRAFNFAIAE